MKTRYTLIALVIVAIIAFFGIKGCQKKNAVIGDIVSSVDIRQDSTVHYRDKFGREHAEKMEIIADREAIKIAYKSEIEELKKSNNIKDKQINGLVLAQTKTSGTVYLLQNPDTFYKFEYKDRYVGFNLDSNQLKYEVKDSLFLVQYWKRKCLLCPKTNYIDGRLSNPNSHIINLESARVSYIEPSRIGAGVYAGYGFFGEKGFSVGLGISYQIIRNNR